MTSWTVSKLYLFITYAGLFGAGDGKCVLENVLNLKVNKQKQQNKPIIVRVLVREEMELSGRRKERNCQLNTCGPLRGSSEPQ